LNKKSRVAVKKCSRDVTFKRNYRTVTATLDLPKTIEEKLRQQAARRGMGIDRLILQELEQQIGEPAPETVQKSESEKET
jgi:hypothetical protein